MVIVFNPVAGRRRAQLLWRVLDVLVANGVRLDLAETHRPGHAESLARDAAQRGETMVVAAGGDGTIAEVANGLMGSSARLGVIPLGAPSPAFEPGAPGAPGTTRPAVVAAWSSGLTLLVVGSWWGAPVKEPVGVCDPVPLGVPRLEGSSDVNMVAVLGETR